MMCIPFFGPLAGRKVPKPAQLILPDWSIRIPTWSPHNAREMLPGSSKLKKTTAQTNPQSSKNLSI